MTIRNKKVIIIGAGLGGLSAAIRLAYAGCRVTVLEAQQKAGGKLQRIETKGYRFDRGPSTITMPDMFRGVFAAVGREMNDYLTMYRLEPSVRNVFADGHVVDLCGTLEGMQEQIALYSPEDAAAYPDFRREAARLHRLAEERFLSRLMLDLSDKLRPELAMAFARIRPFTALHTLLRRFFKHPNTLAMLGRYATYVGSSPYEAPAIFAMLAQVESNGGVYGVQGGTYAIVEAYERLAKELGADIRTGTPVRRILVRNGKAAGVETDDGELAADIVVAGADVLTVYRELIDEADRPAFRNKAINRLEPSLSGYVRLIGIRRTYDQLLHHTVYFPHQYEEEFHSIFKRMVPPEHPAVYICNTSASEIGAGPPGGSSLFVLVNAPSLSDRWDWRDGDRRDDYEKSVSALLERIGLTGLDRADVSMAYTPADLAADTGAHRGAIYGISSNSARQTFARPSNRAKDITGLWFVGGTTHPGGGTPIVSQSGRLVAERLIRMHGG